MAKVSTIEFELKGTKYKAAVKCGVSGIFTMDLPSEVATPLNLRTKLENATLAGLEKDFQAILTRYKNAATTQEIFIAIQYGASGKFQQRANGSYLFGSNDRMCIQRQFANRGENLLMFNFQVVIKETVDGAIKHFIAKKGSEFTFQDDKTSQPDKYFKESEFRGVGDYKLIPFSEAALQSLENAHEKLRSVSELLFDFISQDTKMIEATLTSNKFLN